MVFGYYFLYNDCILGIYIYQKEFPITLTEKKIERMESQEHINFQFIMLWMEWQMNFCSE